MMEEEIKKYKKTNIALSILLIIMIVVSFLCTLAICVII
jgi:hypothetical protein